MNKAEAFIDALHTLAADFNPYHDARGRFTSGGGNYASFTVTTKDPSKQHWANAAVEREKMRAAGGGSSGNDAYAAARQKVQSLKEQKSQAYQESNQHLDKSNQYHYAGNAEKSNEEYKKYEESLDRYEKLNSEIHDVKESAGIESTVGREAFDSDIEYRPVQHLEKTLSDNEIIDKVGGGDMTGGSCSSLALAYAANKNGLDVTDYRGGDSREFFGRTGNIKRIAELDGVSSNIVEHTNDYKSAISVLQNVETGKNYYFFTGKHAAIVRKGSSGIEYLELQSSRSNGWNPLTKEGLKSRFGAQKSHSVAGRRYNASSGLIDVSTLKGNTEFERLMGYINTSTSSQQKGAGGYAK